MTGPLGRHGFPQFLFGFFIAVNVFLLMNCFVSVVVDSFEYIRDHKGTLHDLDLEMYLNDIKNSFFRYTRR